MYPTSDFVKPNPTATLLLETPSCPLCHSAARKIYRLSHTSVYCCDAEACHLQFASPQPDEDALLRYYDQFYYPVAEHQKVVFENSPEFTIRQLLKAIALKSISPAGKRVLDYGCGKGTLLRAVSTVCAEAIGIEQNAEARDSIRREGFASAHSSLDDLKRERPEARFDLVFMNDVVEHLRRPWEDLARIGCVLAPEGRLVLNTMNSSSLRSRLAGASWEERCNPTHLYYFTADSLAMVLRRAGYGRVLKLRPVTEYGHHGPLRRTLQRALVTLGLQGELLFVAGEFALPEPALSTSRIRKLG